MMSNYAITRDGTTWQLRDDPDGEIADLLNWIIDEKCHQSADGPLLALSRQQIVSRLGKGMPADFPEHDVVTGDPEQGGVRGWWETTVQNYIAGVRTSAAAPADEVDDEPAGLHAPGRADAWPLRSRQWDDVEYSGADDRVLIVTTFGIVNPAGAVVKPPLGEPGNLLKLAVKYPWASGEGEADPQIWITGQALRELDFPVPGPGSTAKLEDIVGDFFGCDVTYQKSGFFTCAFPTPDPTNWPDRKVDVVLMPYTHSEPSKSRPDDRGVLGIVGTPTILPADEAEAAHLLGDRIAWLYGLEGALPGPRWSRVGGKIARVRMGKARPTIKNDPGAKLVPCPLPSRLSKSGNLPYAWWTKDSWNRKHRANSPGVDVEVDQQAAYLPSAEGVYLGWGTPEFVTPDPAWFDQQRPPFLVAQITVPPANKCDGISPKLPVPHPGMSWTKEATFPATTIDIQQLLAPVENGGAGLTVAEIDFHVAYVWPEQHQWLKQFAILLRTKLAEARAADRLDYQQMSQALYKSVFGRCAAVGDSAWSYPYLQLQQPAWFGAIEGLTRWRAMRYACRIARDFNLYPTECMVDAWFYRVPEGFKPHQLEDPLDEKTGLRKNGSYRLKALPPAAETPDGPLDAEADDS